MADDVAPYSIPFTPPPPSQTPPPLNPPSTIAIINTTEGTIVDTTATTSTSTVEKEGEDTKDSNYSLALEALHYLTLTLEKGPDTEKKQKFRNRIAALDLTNYEDIIKLFALSEEVLEDSDAEVEGKVPEVPSVDSSDGGRGRDRGRDSTVQDYIEKGEEEPKQKDEKKVPEALSEDSPDCSRDRDSTVREEVETATQHKEVEEKKVPETVPPADSPDSGLGRYPSRESSARDYDEEKSKHEHEIRLVAMSRKVTKRDSIVPQGRDNRGHVVADSSVREKMMEEKAPEVPPPADSPGSDRGRDSLVREKVEISKQKEKRAPEMPPLEDNRPIDGGRDRGRGLDGNVDCANENDHQHSMVVDNCDVQPPPPPPSPQPRMMVLMMHRKPLILNIVPVGTAGDAPADIPAQVPIGNSATYYRAPNLATEQEEEQVSARPGIVIEDDPNNSDDSLDVPVNSVAVSTVRPPSRMDSSDYFEDILRDDFGQEDGEDSDDDDDSLDVPVFSQTCRDYCLDEDEDDYSRNIFDDMIDDDDGSGQNPNLMNFGGEEGQDQLFGGGHEEPNRDFPEQLVEVVRPPMLQEEEEIVRDCVAADTVGQIPEVLKQQPMDINEDNNTEHIFPKDEHVQKMDIEGPDSGQNGHHDDDQHREEGKEEEASGSTAPILFPEPVHRDEVVANDTSSGCPFPAKRYPKRVLRPTTHKASTPKNSIPKNIIPKNSVLKNNINPKSSTRKIIARKPDLPMLATRTSSRLKGKKKNSYAISSTEDTDSSLVVDNSAADSMVTDSSVMDSSSMDTLAADTLNVATTTVDSSTMDTTAADSMVTDSSVMDSSSMDTLVADTSNMATTPAGISKVATADTSSGGRPQRASSAGFNDFLAKVHPSKKKSSSKNLSKNSNKKHKANIQQLVTSTNRLREVGITLNSLRSRSSSANNNTTSTNGPSKNREASTNRESSTKVTTTNTSNNRTKKKNAESNLKRLRVPYSKFRIDSSKSSTSTKAAYITTTPKQSKPRILRTIRSSSSSSNTTNRRESRDSEYSELTEIVDPREYREFESPQVELRNQQNLQQNQNQQPQVPQESPNKNNYNTNNTNQVPPQTTYQPPNPYQPQNPPPPPVYNNWNSYQPSPPPPPTPPPHQPPPPPHPHPPPPHQPYPQWNSGPYPYLPYNYNAPPYDPYPHHQYPPNPAYGPPPHPPPPHPPPPPPPYHDYYNNSYNYGYNRPPPPPQPPAPYGYPPFNHHQNYGMNPAYQPPPNNYYNNNGHYNYNHNNQQQPSGPVPNYPQYNPNQNNNIPPTDTNNVAQASIPAPVLPPPSTAPTASTTDPSPSSSLVGESGGALNNANMNNEPMMNNNNGTFYQPQQQNQWNWPGNTNNNNNQQSGSTFTSNQPGPTTTGGPFTNVGTQEYSSTLNAIPPVVSFVTPANELDTNRQYQELSNPSDPWRTGGNAMGQPPHPHHQPQFNSNNNIMPGQSSFTALKNYQAPVEPTATITYQQWEQQQQQQQNLQQQYEQPSSSSGGFGGTASQQEDPNNPNQQVVVTTAPVTPTTTSRNNITIQRNCPTKNRPRLAGESEHDYQLRVSVMAHRAEYHRGCRQIMTQVGLSQAEKMRRIDELKKSRWAGLTEEQRELARQRDRISRQNFKQSMTEQEYKDYGKGNYRKRAKKQ